MFTQYIHHGHKVWVIRWLRGRHQRHSLCWQCAKFNPDDPTHSYCVLTKLTYNVNRVHGLLTVVWECAEFVAAAKPHRGVHLKKPFDFEEWLGENTCFEDADEQLIICTTEDEGVTLSDYNGYWRATGKDLEEACLRYTALKEGK